MHPFEYLKYVGEITEIEDVVEFDGGRQECGGHALMERQCQLYQLGTALLQNLWESLTTEVLT